MSITNNYQVKTNKKRKSGLWKGKVKIHKDFDTLPKEVERFFVGKVTS